MRKGRRVVLAACAAIGLGAVTSIASAAEMRAEVIHWWTSGGESAAVKVFADRFKAAGGTWVDAAIAGGENARTAGINRIVGGNPPTVMQFNTGKQFDELAANGLLRDIDAIADAEHWRQVMPKAFVQAATYDGKFYAAPVNIHGQNWLFYNEKVFDRAGVQPPATWPDLVKVGNELKAKNVIPLALGGESWQERVLFNAVLLGHGGPELYQAIFANHDQDAIRGAKFREVAQIFGSLRGLVDPGSPGRNWNDATALVSTGKAGMQLMGDWAKGEFAAAGMTAGKDYGCVFVGQNQDIIMGGDVFVFPKTSDPAAQAAQDKMAEVMLDPATQIAFNTVKGSMPVRLDVDTSKMDACAQKGEKAIADPARQIPVSDMLITPDLSGALDDVITQYWNNAGMDAAQFVELYSGAIETAG